MSETTKTEKKSNGKSLLVKIAGGVLTFLVITAMAASATTWDRARNNTKDISEMKKGVITEIKEWQSEKGEIINDVPYLRRELEQHVEDFKEFSSDIKEKIEESAKHDIEQRQATNEILMTLRTLKD